MQKFIIAIICFLFLTCAVVQAHSEVPKLFPVHKKGKGGFIDKTGKIIIPLKFDAVGDFSEGFARVEINDKWGFIDESGKIVIEPQFSWAWNFMEGMASVQVGGTAFSPAGRWGFIDKFGQIVVKPEYDELTGVAETSEGFHEGLAMVELDYKKGFIDKSGKMIIEPQFAYGYPFTEGLACVSTGLDEKWGCIDKFRNWTVPQIFDDASLFSEGYSSVTFNGVCGFIDKTGKSVLEPKFENDANGDCSVVIGDFTEGLSRWRIGDKFGYIDKSGKVVIGPKFDYTDQFSEGLAWVEIDGKIGFVDKSGKIVIELKEYNHVENFSGGLAYVVTQNGEHGYINKAGNYVWKPAKQSE